MRQISKHDIKGLIAFSHFIVKNRVYDDTNRNGYNESDNFFK